MAPYRVDRILELISLHEPLSDQQCDELADTVESTVGDPVDYYAILADDSGHDVAVMLFGRGQTLTIRADGRAQFPLDAPN